MKKKKCLFLIFVLFTYSLIAEQNVLYKLYGFVGNDFFINSRKNIEGADGIVQILPFPKKEDALGNDLNEFANGEMLSINTRLGLDMSGVDVLNATVSAKIESDFAGASSSFYLLRIRRAYVNMKWKKSALLVGQDWHPMSSSVMPSLFNANGGAPFQPFNRSPQVNYTYQFDQLKVISSALYEMQYVSDGPLGKSNVYMKNAVIPNIFLGFEKKNKHWLLGVGADYKTLTPRTESSIGTPAVVYKVSEKVNSLSYLAYAAYQNKKLTIKAKTIYGENINNMLMIGGYGVTDINASTGEQAYAPFQSATGWVNIVYGKDWKYALFLGYTQNLGVKSDIVGAIYDSWGYADEKKVQSAYKISPQVSYRVNNWQVGLEYDYTLASHGLMNSKGIAKDTEQIANHRLLSVLMYHF